LTDGIELTAEERSMLEGDQGAGVQLAVRIVIAAAKSLEACRLRPVTRAHVDACLYHGPSGQEMLDLLLRDETQVRIPTTLNTGLLDLTNPADNDLDGETAAAARGLMEGYQALGCSPTFTCAPYQLPSRPRLGEQIAWGESNAIVFANSVIGARTNRYGDIIDVCAAITGLVPDAGLHRDEARAATVVIDLTGLPDPVLRSELTPALTGLVAGRAVQGQVPAILGLPADADEDSLKAVGAAAASSGSVGLFHAVGITPEAADLESALQGREPVQWIEVTPELLESTRAEISGTVEGHAIAVCVGTPHASPRELRRLAALIDGRRVASGLDFYVSTNRFALEVASEAVEVIDRAGVTVVVDTCTYLAPPEKLRRGTVMTNSAKWAYYAPTNVGNKAVFATLEECVNTAVSGSFRQEPLL
jgi:predicted aconitase